MQLDTQGDAVKAMVVGNLDAVAANDAILYGHQLLNPGLNVVGARLSDEVYGAGVQKGQSDLLNAVNKVIRNLKTSGKWKEIWKKEIGDQIGIQTLPDPPSDALPK